MYSEISQTQSFGILILFLSNSYIYNRLGRLDVYLDMSKKKKINNRNKNIIKTLHNLFYSSMILFLTNYWFRLEYNVIF